MIQLFPPELKQYFAFTDDQVLRISGFNRQLDLFRVEKLRRQVQVQSEIAEEEARPLPDPTAVGLRYVELEAIRRELTAEQKKTADGIRAVLNVEQKAKLVVLEQVLSLQSTACQAVSQNLLTQPTAVIRNPFPGNRIPGLGSGPFVAPGTCPPTLTGIILPNPLVP